jgi:hypothetical protein
VPSLSVRSVSRRALPIVVILVAGALLGACQADPDAPASFNPAAACNGADSQIMAGAYPELEALLPTSLAGVAPTSLVSGRFCSATTLGSLYTSGIRETHFGSAVWNRNGGSGIQMTIMEAPGLTVDNAIQSYGYGAANAPKVHLLTSKDVTVNGIAGKRLDIENDDFQQEVIIWPTDVAGRLHILIGSNVHPPDLDAALAAFH